MKQCWLYLIPLIFMFFPAFSVLIDSKPVVIYFILLVAVFSLCFVLFSKKTIRLFKILYKISPLKYFLFFAGWILLSGMFLVIKGGYSLGVFLYYIFALLFVDYFLTYLLPAYTYDRKNFNIKSFIKLLVFAYFVIFTVAIFEFIGKQTGLDVLTLPSEILGNQRNLIGGGTLAGHYLDRVRSVFAEPGWLGCFIFINLPIIYSISLSKFSVFKNSVINCCSKYLLIPMTWFTIVVEQSAIWLVFCIILTAIYFKKYIIDFIKKNLFLVISGFMVFIALVLLLINTLSGSMDIGYYARIINFFQNATSLTALADTDHSLGSRIISYYLSIKTALGSPILGVGFGNLKYCIADTFAASNIPLTFEIYNNYQMSLIQGKMNYAGAILYEYFAELGIIGLCLFYVFVFKVISGIKKIKKFYHHSIELDFIKGIEFTTVSVACILFYDVPETYYYIWFIFGITNIFLLNTYQRLLFEKGKSHG